MKVETEAGAAWRASLSEWAIPSEILNQAPEPPYIHPPANFGVPEVIEETISHARAREALGTSILDIGCGGGIAAMACIPPATYAIGVDHQAEMLTMFAANATARGASSSVHEGFWPAIANEVESADVVTAHHVVYNVQEIEDFLLALDAHAHRRVVIEMPQSHPQSSSAPAWEHFWGVVRPVDPSPSDLMKVLESLGISANCEMWEGHLGRGLNLEQEAEFMRIRLCLPKEREPEVAEFLQNQPRIQNRPLATIWWDKTSI